MLVDSHKSGFKILRHDDKENTSSSSKNLQKKVVNFDQNIHVAMLQKLHEHTKIFGLLVYKGELKGIRYFDSANHIFIDIAPWQLKYFNISAMRVIGVRELELSRVEAGPSSGTLVIEYLTQHEMKGIYRPNRMTSNDLAMALSYVKHYVNDAEYELLLQKFR